MITIALKSLWNRRGTVLLSLLSIIICVALLLGVERIRTGLKSSFARTVSGVDLIVGPRTGGVNLLLYAVFHIGSPINTIDYASYRRWAEDEKSAWSFPLSLGDSHRGFRIVGTDNALFEHYRYADDRQLALAKGSLFDDPFDVVLGADVAAKTRYKIGDPVVVAHGTGRVALSQHDNLPFAVKGILKPTGTPLDRALFVPVEGITAIHIGWESGREVKGVTKEDVMKADLTPKTITAFFLGVERKSAIFAARRAINEYETEPLSAIMPGVALYELWSMMSVAEKSLAFIAIFVVLISLVGMLITEITALTIREREMALLRTLGARPTHLFRLLFLESLIISTTGTLLGLLFLYPLHFSLLPLLSVNGIYLPLTLPTMDEIRLLFFAWGAGVAMGLIPAFTAYRQTLHESLIVKT